MVYGKCIGSRSVHKIVYLGEGELFSCKCTPTVIIEINVGKKTLWESLSAVL